MTNTLQAMVEIGIGPMGRKVVIAIGLDWPGLERNGVTEENALAAM